MSFRDRPHYYKSTIPYQGCAVCGYGPGALTHNSYEVERYLAAGISEDTTQEVGRCHECGCYYEITKDNNRTCCSDKCTDRYIGYLNESIRNNR